MTFIEKKKFGAISELNSICRYCNSKGRCPSCIICEAKNQIQRVKPVQISINNEIEEVVFI